MAIYHLSIKIISRGRGGKSAVAAAAYRAGERIICERDGKTYDYTRKRGVAHTEVILPVNAPLEYADRSVLWNEVEKVEKAKNSQLAREIEIALPIELTEEQNISLVREYVKRNFVDEGMCADICVHDIGKDNPHAHVLLTLRPFNDDKTWGDKQRKEYILDRNGGKIYEKKKRQYKCKSVPTTDWNEQTKAEQWRAAWGEIVNQQLEKYNHPARIDHRSYARQGLDLIPSIKLGVAASQMERRGISTERGKINRQIEVDNREIRMLKARINKVKSWLYNAPITGTPTLLEMMNGMAGGERLKSQWKRIANLKVQANVLMFLTSNGIYNDVEKLAAKVEQMHRRHYEVAGRIKEIDRRTAKLKEHIANVDVYNQHRAVYRKYKQFEPKKQSAYYQKHKSEIEQYRAAYQYLKAHLNGRTVIHEKEWRSEHGKLTTERYMLCEEYYKLKDDVKNVEALRRGAESIMGEGVPERTQKREQDISL